jgi:hypothetical protein
MLTRRWRVRLLLLGLASVVMTPTARADEEFDCDDENCELEAGTCPSRITDGSHVWARETSATTDPGCYKNDLNDAGSGKQYLNLNCTPNPDSQRYSGTWRTSPCINP